MENTSQRRKGRFWWWTVGVVVTLSMALGWYVTTPSVLAPLAAPRPTDKAAKHKPVYLRVGTIVELGQSSFKLKTDKLEGEGAEVITVKTTPQTTVIEVRVPKFVDPQSVMAREDERAVVSFFKLYRGQEVAVLANEDMYGRSEVAATRVEYLKTI